MTKHDRDRNETILSFREGMAKPLLVKNSAIDEGPKGPRQGDVMIKALSAIAVAAAIAAGLTLLPGFAPQVEASTPQALARADRLDIRPAGSGCSQQAWPNFEASCLRRAGTRTLVRPVRIVTTDRTH